MSGVDLPDGHILRKGAVDAVLHHVADKFGTGEPSDLAAVAAVVANQGPTPLAVSLDGQILGFLKLSDVLKTGIRERIAQLPKMGIRSVMLAAIIH